MMSLKLVRSSFVVLIILGLIAALTFIFTRDDEPEPFDRSRDSQALAALERNDEIVLLGATTQGVHEVENHREIFGDRKIWGTSKVVLIQYQYQSKLGFDGAEVNIKPKRNNHFEIIIPEFIFIGYDNIEMETKMQKDGWLSFGTEDIDSGAVVTEIMTTNKVEELIDMNRDLLETEAKEFYEGLAMEFDNEIELEFKFK